MQKQRFAANQAQEAKFAKFAKQVSGFLETTQDFFVTPLSDDWAGLEEKGTKYGAFLVTKNPVQGGRRFSIIPEFFDPARLNPLMVSVPTGKVMTNIFLFVGAQDGFFKSLF